SARELNISQPAVTAAVQKLEERYSVKLFFRYPRGLELTPAGMLLYRHLKELKMHAVQAENELMNLKGVVHGQLKLGASPTFGDYILPRLIGRFSSGHPGISFSLVIGNNQQIYNHLKEGKVELAFLAGKLPGKRITAHKIMEDELILIVPSGHPWSSRGTIDQAELLTQPLILREQGSSSRKETEEALMELGFDLEILVIVAEFFSLEAIKSAVEAGLGAALISRWAVTKELQLGTLCSVQINGLSHFRDINAVTLNDIQLTEAASRLLRYSLHMPPGFTALPAAGGK
ncbi:MAG: LysR family transcriptional regulator, partial [Bacillota bacterium]